MRCKVIKVFLFLKKKSIWNIVLPSKTLYFLMLLYSLGYGHCVILHINTMFLAFLLHISSFLFFFKSIIKIKIQIISVIKIKILSFRSSIDCFCIVSCFKYFEPTLVFYILFACNSLFDILFDQLFFIFMAKMVV